MAGSKGRNGRGERSSFNDLLIVFIDRDTLAASFVMLK